MEFKPDLTNWQLFNDENSSETVQDEREVRRYNLLNLKYASHDFVLRLLKENNESESSCSPDLNTDLVPNQYEGGFKLWESTADLITYLSKNQQLIRSNLRILDVSF